mgnify:CR=1 FL=1
MAVTTTKINGTVLKVYIDTVLLGYVTESSFDTSANIIETSNKDTNKLSEIAFDMEMYNQGTAVRTCLIQLTSNTMQKDYIIDPLAAGVWDAIPSHLGPLFSDPSILKIGHGIGGMDCSSLHRDFGILVVNAFDTCEASSIARQSKGGLNLAALCKHYGLQTWEHYRDLKDRFQTTNWCKRPLSEEALEYGRYDVRYLITLRRLLMRDLIKMDMIKNKYSNNHIKIMYSRYIIIDETRHHGIKQAIFRRLEKV